MVTIELDRTYPVPAAAVWRRISDFYDMSWLPAIAASRTLADRASRVAVLPGGAGEVVERLLEQGDRFHRYEVTDAGPMPLAGFTAILRVEDVGEASSQVVWRARFEPAGVAASEAAAAVTGVFSSALDRLAELDLTGS